MKKIAMMVISTVLMVAGAFQAAKAELVFSWMQDIGGNGATIVTTLTTTNTQSVATSLDHFTSWNVDITLNSGVLNIARQNILPYGPGAGTAYYAGPFTVGLGGNVLSFSTWLSPSAVSGSSESIYNIVVNGIPLLQTVTASWSNPTSQFVWTNSLPVTHLTFDYSMNAVNGTVETGVGVKLLTSSASQTISITSSPQSQATNAGANVTFTVALVGVSPIHFQWRFNNQNLAGATNASLTLNAVGAGNAGSYSVVVWNAYGTTTSAPAQLAVLGVTASQQSPVQITTLAPIKLPGKTNLVLVTHGYILPEELPILPAWVTNLANSISAHVSNDWQVVAFDWSLNAWGGNWGSVTPSGALDNANTVGDSLGKQIAAQHWQHIHLIAHSAGAGLIQRVADIVRSNSPGTTIHTTFLDPFLGLFYGGLKKYGANADWSDNYFAHDFVTDDLGAIILSPNLTGGRLQDSHNVDVAWIDPNHWVRTQTTILNPLTGQRTETYQVFSSHGWPYDFYSNSVAGTAGVCATNFGFPLSKEGGGWLSHAAFPTNNEPNPLCGYPAVTIYTPPPKNFFPVAQLSGLPKMTSGSHVDIFSPRAFTFSTYFQNAVPQGGPQPHGGPVSTNAVSAWLEVALTITNQINYLQFEAGFADTNAAEGLLSVYWETNQIGLVDERVAGTGMQTYQFALPKTVASGIAILSFRLDSFNGTTSSMVVSNVATGYIGITEPLTLGISLTNQTPLLQLTGASNYNYLVQSSTNLVNWSPLAYLPNTNGTVWFFDDPVTNSPARFYRAVMP